MPDRHYQMCSHCVMDTTDPDITFDIAGVCNHCQKFESETRKRWFPNDEGEHLLARTISEVKKIGRGQEYDCIIGLSGGVDSSYLALKVKDFGLRPLVVHVDAGWNSELAVYNIEQVVKYCNYDLHTHVINWDEMRDLQLAYLKAGVANQDVPQDHAFFASLYHFAVKSNIKYVISGGNIATESVFPAAWQHAAMDAINLHDIHRRHGTLELNDYKTISILQYYLYYPFIYRMQTIRPLNYMDYDKRKAVAYLKQEIGYKEYGRKHGESVFTKFFQNYYSPVKFGYDIRRPHLSSLILSGQKTRKDALAELEEPLYESNELKEDKAYIAKKLQISTQELDAYISAPNGHYSQYKNWNNRLRFLKAAQTFAERVLQRDIKNYG